MATTVEDVVNAVLAAVECDAGPELVATWVSERYRELTNRTRCRHLLRFTDLVMPAAVIDGLVTVTAGSPVLVGDTDARAAWAALGTAIVGRHIRLANQRHWYRISGTTGDGDLIVTVPFAPMPDAPSDPIGYTLVQRWLPLPPDVRHVGIVRHPRLSDPLEEIAHQELDLAMPGRVLVADIPKFWAETEPQEDGTKRLEVYPYAKTDQILAVSYYAVPPTLALKSSLPSGIDLHVLKAGALVDVYRWEMAKALKANQPETAATWRNEMNSATTRWDEKIKEAIKAERVSETATFWAPTGGFPSGGDHMIRDARDLVWARGRRS
jgi:hypothetical protein